MEYVKVVYPTPRLVNIDGVQSGGTGEVLRIDPGSHAFDLGNPVDYEPASQNRMVTGTTVLLPMVVAFANKGS
jgi:hypothetical protein